MFVSMHHSICLELHPKSHNINEGMKFILNYPNYLCGAMLQGGDESHSTPLIYHLRASVEKKQGPAISMEGMEFILNYPNYL